MDSLILLGDIKNLSDVLQKKLYLLGIEIENIFFQIRESQSIESAQQYFNLLEKIQSTLAELVFTERIKISNSLWFFVKEFDRLDDQDLRRYLYKEIKENRYFFKR